MENFISIIKNDDIEQFKQYLNNNIKNKKELRNLLFNKSINSTQPLYNKKVLIELIFLYGKNNIINYVIENINIKNTISDGVLVLLYSKNENLDYYTFIKLFDIFKNSDKVLNRICTGALNNNPMDGLFNILFKFDNENHKKVLDYLLSTLENRYLIRFWVKREIYGTKYPVSRAVHNLYKNKNLKNIEEFKIFLKKHFKYFFDIFKDYDILKYYNESDYDSLHLTILDTDNENISIDHLKYIINNEIPLNLDKKYILYKTIFSNLKLFFNKDKKNLLKELKNISNEDIEYILNKLEYDILGETNLNIQIIDTILNNDIRYTKIFNKNYIKELIIYFNMNSFIEFTNSFIKDCFKEVLLNGKLKNVINSKPVLELALTYINENLNELLLDFKKFTSIYKVIFHSLIKQGYNVDKKILNDFKNISYTYIDINDFHKIIYKHYNNVLDYWLQNNISLPFFPLYYIDKNKILKKDEKFILTSIIYINTLKNINKIKNNDKIYFNVLKIFKQYDNDINNYFKDLPQFCKKIIVYEQNIDELEKDISKLNKSFLIKLIKYSIITENIDLLNCINQNIDLYSIKDRSGNNFSDLCKKFNKNIILDNLRDNEVKI